MKILSIEDDSDFVFWIQRLFSDAGLKVSEMVQADTMKSALERAPILAPSIILLDINLLDTRGLETVGFIPSLDAIAPVVIVSGLGLGIDLDADLLSACYAAGAVGHIFKKCAHPNCTGLIAGIIASSGYNWRRIHGRS